MPKIILDGKYRICPNDIDWQTRFYGAFDHTPTETSARYIILLCQQKGAWSPFTLAEIESLYEQGEDSRFSFNRLVEPGWGIDDPSLIMGVGLRNKGPVGGGWIIRDTHGNYYITDDFVDRCYKASPATSPELATK